MPPARFTIEHYSRFGVASPFRCLGHHQFHSDGRLPDEHTTTLLAWGSYRFLIVPFATRARRRLMMTVALISSPLAASRLDRGCGGRGGGERQNSYKHNSHRAPIRWAHSLTLRYFHTQNLKLVEQ